MKIAATLTALALGLSTTGFAYADSLSNYPVDTAATATSTLTRAQVQQELQQAQATGLLIIGENPAYPMLAQHDNNKARAEVLSELRHAQAAGLVHSADQANYPVGFSA